MFCCVYVVYGFEKFVALTGSNLFANQSVFIDTLKGLCFFYSGRRFKNWQDSDEAKY